MSCGGLEPEQGYYGRDKALEKSPADFIGQ